jgi:DNA-binding NarL/FixJ family response regulator
MEAIDLQMVRVFLVDDHDLVRRGVRELLEEQGDMVVVGEAATADQAIEGINSVVPDVALLDARLPDGTGMEVCREVRSRHPEVAVLILTSFDDDSALFSAILAVAAGFVHKLVRSSDLVSFVLRAAAGQSTLDPEVTRRVLDRVRSGRRLAMPAGLTPQETRVLEHIGRGLTNRQIAEEMLLTEKTVKNYVSSVLAKLGVSSRTKAALVAVHAEGAA